MKVQLAVVKAEYRETRALEPHMHGKPFTADSRLADFIEGRSNGRIRRVEPEPPPHIPEAKRRGRPPKKNGGGTAPNGNGATQADKGND